MCVCIGERASARAMERRNAEGYFLLIYLSLEKKASKGGSCVCLCVCVCVCVCVRGRGGAVDYLNFLAEGLC